MHDCTVKPGQLLHHVVDNEFYTVIDWNMANVRVYAVPYGGDHAKCRITYIPREFVNLIAYPLE